MVSRARWSIAGQAGVAGIQLLQMMMLARLLDASDFGLGAIYVLLVAAGQLFWDFGTSAAVIQRRDVTPGQLRTLQGLNVVLSLVFASLVVLCAPFLAALVNRPDAASMLQWAGAAALIAAIGAQFRALHLRHMHLRRLALVDILAALVSCVASIAAARLHMGAYAFVVASIVTAAMNTILLVSAGTKLRPPSAWVVSDIRYFIRFGAFQTGSASINFAYLNLDIVLLSALLGTTDLGRYALAKQICLRPLEIIYPILLRSMLPQLAHLQGSLSAMADFFLGGFRVLCAVYLPLFAVLVVAADQWVPLLLGPNWHEVIALFQVLAAAHVLRFLMVPTSVFLMATGKVSRAFYWDLAASAGLAAAVIGFHPNSALSMAVVLLCAYALLLFPHWYFMIRTNLKLHFTDWANAILRPMLIAAATTCTAGVTMQMLEVGPIVRIAAIAIFGFGLYVALSLWLNKPALHVAKQSGPVELQYQSPSNGSVRR